VVGRGDIESLVEATDMLSSIDDFSTICILAFLDGGGGEDEARLFELALALGTRTVPVLPNSGLKIASTENGKDVQDCTGLGDRLGRAPLKNGGEEA
jgi:hypothetical protein